MSQQLVDVSEERASVENLQALLQKAARLQQEQIEAMASIIENLQDRLRLEGSGEVAKDHQRWSALSDEHRKLMLQQQQISEMTEQIKQLIKLAYGTDYHAENELSLAPRSSREMTEHIQQLVRQHRLAHGADSAAENTLPLAPRNLRPSAGLSDALDDGNDILQGSCNSENISADQSDDEDDFPSEDDERGIIDYESDVEFTDERMIPNYPDSDVSQNSDEDIEESILENMSGIPSGRNEERLSEDLADSLLDDTDFEAAAPRLVWRDSR